MNLDPQSLERAVLLVERISLNVEKITRAMGEVAEEVDDVLDTADEGLEDLTRQVYDVRYEVDEMFRWIEQRALPRHEFGLLGPFFGADAMDRMLEMADRKMKRWADEMRRHMEARGPLSSLGKMSGLSSVMGGMGALRSQLFAGMPFGVGGLLGMALWGASREEYFAAASRRALFTLQAVGGAGQKQLGLLTGQARSFYRSFGEEGLELLRATAGAFAELSVGEEMFDRAGVSAKGFMRNVLGVATAVDLMNAAAPGTTARFIGETMQNMGVGAREASDQVFRMAAALREAKLNYSSFAAGIVQANSALRMQNQSLDDTTRLFNGLRKRFEMQGMSPQRAAAMALSGVQAATQAISGLPPGLLGVLGQRMKARGAAGFAELGDPVALLQRMKEGLAGKGGAFASSVFEELRSLSSKAVGTGGSMGDRRGRQTFFLESLGMGFEAARAIVDGEKATEALLSPAERSAKFAGDLNAAFAVYARNQSQFERDMRTMQDTLAQIGSDILTWLTASGTMLIEEVKNLPLRFKALTTGVTTKEQAKLDTLDAFTLGVKRIQDQSLSATAEKLGQIVDIAKGSALRATAGRLGDTQRLLENYRTAAAQAEQGRTMVGAGMGTGGGRIPIAAGSGDEAAHLEAAAMHASEQAKHLDAAARARKKPMPVRRMERPVSPAR